MAHYPKPIFFLLLVVLFSFLQIEARESKFFTKAIHYNIPLIESSSSLTPAPAPALAPELESLAPALSPELESPAPAPVETEYGYGLFGQGADEYPSTKTTTEELKSESYKEYNFGDSHSNNNNNNNGYYSTPLSYNNNNNNKEGRYSTPTSYNNNEGYSTPSSYNNGYSTSSRYNNNNGYSTPSSYNNENGYSTSSLYENNNNGYSTSSSYNKNGYSTPSSYNNNERYTTPSSYNNNGYTSTYSSEDSNVKSEPQGLSDTRFLNNGKYYNNMNNENYNPNKYESTTGSTNNYEGYSGNGEKSKYEFDSMEEYDRQQGYPEEYIP